MNYWMVWVSCLLGIFAGIFAYRYIVCIRKKQTIFGVLAAAAIIFLACFGSYFVVYGSFPNLTGLERTLRGVWKEAVRTIKSIWQQIRSSLT